jgi:hypothetical protein
MAGLQQSVKMEGHTDVRMKQACVTQFLTGQNIAPIKIHRRFRNVYRDMAVDVSKLDGGLGVSVIEIVVERTCEDQAALAL